MNRISGNYHETGFAYNGVHTSVFLATSAQAWMVYNSHDGHAMKVIQAVLGLVDEWVILL